MTEPVAYLAKSRKSGAVNATVKEWSYHDFENIPLYTKEQLQPKVQMTQAEFNEFNKLLLSSAVTIYEVIDTIYKDNGKMNEFLHLYQRLFNRNDKLELENQLEFSKLWADFNIDNQEEMIEIVPDMKWFVRSKEFDDGVYKVLEDIRLDYYEYGNVENDEEIAEYGHRFDTKEEAEQWTNPLTEAVQLPVEDE
ncbi:hypothetical protein [Leuconostoc mesenteroides]|uniref:hypothetical protein n=1 Tax=Leuconostoc mesenteroides TaxID=1245 RepID=UPI001CBDDA30|nr:hypothetical protein [Leuconostoc mesenteroides]MBZ1530708.1 hypothetical protein [Leuconostoc mesenteroides]